MQTACLHRAALASRCRAGLAQGCTYLTHPVFYEDEVDIHLNPKIGADWQRRGQQKRVVTPGQNEKHYLAGALYTGTGRVSYVGSSSKSSALFISLLKHLKASYRRAKTITLRG